MRTADSVYETLMDTADAMYAEAKLKKLYGRVPSDIAYMAPEELPRIESDQVKALARAVAMLLDDLAGYVEDEVSGLYGVVEDAVEELCFSQCDLEPEAVEFHLCPACVRELEKSRGQARVAPTGELRQ